VSAVREASWSVRQLPMLRQSAGPMTDFQRSHAELRAAVILAGKEIRKLTLGGRIVPCLAF